MYKFLAILLIIGTSQCLLPAPVKSGLKTAWAGIVTVACKCLVDEATSKTSFIPKPLTLKAFTDKVEQITKKSAIDGFNALIDHTRRSRRTNFVGKIWSATTGGVAALGTGLINVGSVGKDLAKKVGTLTGGALGTALKTALCPSTTLLVRAAAAAIGIVTLPACAVSPVSDACKSMIDKVVKRRTLLRRLNSLKRELQNF
jgi:hypothetical protein